MRKMFWGLMIVSSALLACTSGQKNNPRTPAQTNIGDAGGGISARDINIQSEGSQQFVDGAACKATGGKIDSKSDKRYSICSGGHYDGMISADNSEERDCNVVSSNANDLLKKLGDDPGNQLNELMGAAAIALSRCTAQAKAHSPLLFSIGTQMRKACNRASNQVSDLFKIHCYIRAANYLDVII